MYFAFLPPLDHIQKHIKELIQLLVSHGFPPHCLSLQQQRLSSAAGQSCNKPRSQYWLPYRMVFRTRSHPQLQLLYISSTAHVLDSSQLRKVCLIRTGSPDTQRTTTPHSHSDTKPLPASFISPCASETQSIFSQMHLYRQLEGEGSRCPSAAIKGSTALLHPGSAK